MNQTRFITAIGTPLTEDEQLHEEGLEIHLQDQWSHGIGGILIAGSMGAMQLLTDQTYRCLVERSVELSTGCGAIGISASGTTIGSSSGLQMVILKGMPSTNRVAFEPK